MHCPEFYTVKVFLFLPIRFCEKKIGPLELSLTSKAIDIYKGSPNSKQITANNKSNDVLITL